MRERTYHLSEVSFSLQLYTVRDQTAENFVETIRKVAALGYTGVEFAGYGGLSADEMAALLTEAKLVVAGSHVSYQRMSDDLDAEIAYCQAIGAKYMAVPWMPEEWYTAERMRELSRQLNTFGQRCREKGITLGFHNHTWEFREAEGQYLFDLMMAETDPTFVQMELDTYWASLSGVNVPDYMKKYSGRVPWIHLKDMTPEQTFTEVGDGTLDIKAFIETGLAVGTRWFIVENDKPTLPSLESARRSIENLHRLFAK
jgi:sugar phosphate isomerase/epimerase